MSRVQLALNVPDIDEAVSIQNFYGILWSDTRMWSPLMGGEDFWPVILHLAPAAGSTARISTPETFRYSP